MTYTTNTNPIQMNGQGFIPTNGQGFVDNSGKHYWYFANTGTYADQTGQQYMYDGNSGQYIPIVQSNNPYVGQVIHIQPQPYQTATVTKTTIIEENLHHDEGNKNRLKCVIVSVALMIVAAVAAY